MPSSAAERQKRYRERMKNENPNKYKEMQRKNAARTNLKRKRIADFEPEEQVELRRQWRENKKKTYDEEKREGSECLTENNEKAMRNKQRRLETLNYRLKKENCELKGNINQMKKEMCNLKKKLYRSINKNKQLLDLIHQKNILIEKLQLKPNSNNEQEEIRTPCSRANIFIEENLPNISLEEREKVKKRLLEHNVLVDTIKERYENSNLNSEKKVLKNIVSSDIAKKYKMKTKMSSFLGLKGKIRHIQVKKRNFSMLNHLKIFFERDDISVATAGKKEVKTYKKQTRQRRYLLGTLKQLYRKYKSEGGKISFATFKRYRPFYILAPKVNSRNTCACKRHENLLLKASELKSMGIIETKSLDDILLMVVCDAKKIDCAYGECEDCKDKAVEYNLNGKNLDDSVSWSEWMQKKHEYEDKKDDALKKIAKRMVKDRKVGTLQNLLQSFTDELKQFKTHSYNIIHQYKEYQRCIKNLDDHSIAIHIDFSENYSCKLSTEIQAMHFGSSRQQFTLHTGLIYSKGRDPMSFTSISPCNNHGPEAIWAHLSPVLQLIRQEFPYVHALHFFSDGPTVQYRQKKNFYLFCKFTKDLGFPFSTWNFFESAHGKGAADGIGGAIKRKLDSIVSYGSDITDAESAYRLLRETETKIKLFYIPEILQNVNVPLCPVPGTMALHQLRNVQSGNKITYRSLSCFCDKGLSPGYCQCLDIKEHNLEIIHKQDQTVAKKLKRSSENIEEPSRNKYKKKVRTPVAQKSDSNRNRQRKRLGHQKSYDTDTSVESDVTYAESDDSVWEDDEAMEFDQTDTEENDLAAISIKNSKAESTVKNNTDECSSKITVLSEIRYTPQNQAYFDLQKFFPITLNKVDKDFDLFSTLKDKENIRNTNDDPVPSTSGNYNKQKESAVGKIKQENNLKKRKINDVCDVSILELQNMDLDLTDGILEDNNKKIDKKVKEKETSYECDVRDLDNPDFSETANKEEEETEDAEARSKAIDGPNINRDGAEQDLTEWHLNEETGKQTEKNKRDSCDNKNLCNQTVHLDNNETEKPNEIMEETIISVNDSVLVRYYEKKKWVYYVGFVECKDLEIKNLKTNNYSIRFLKTVKKPNLKFISTKKLDRDIVPDDCIVKKVILIYESREYTLSDKADHIYFGQ